MLGLYRRLFLLFYFQFVAPMVFFLCFYFLQFLPLLFVVFFFFFSSRRRHTRCLSDWSSDVCSSDLDSFDAEVQSPVVGGGYHGVFIRAPRIRRVGLGVEVVATLPSPGGSEEIGRASCRERV